MHVPVKWEAHQLYIFSYIFTIVFFFPFIELSDNIFEKLNHDYIYILFP